MKFDMLLTNEDQPAMGIHIKTAKAVDTENTAFRIDEQLGGLKLGQSDLSEAESDPVSDNDSIVSHSTSATSLSSSPSRSDLEHRPEAPGLYYESQPNGPTYPVPKEDLAPVFDCNAADKLIAASQQDRIVQQSCPTVHKNGVHVFLDLSNIHIGFLNTLKDKVGLPPAIRFWPNPVFNLEDLTAIITRGRTVRTLRAGCSILPGRSKPAFISELRRLKYQVDIRERKPTHEPKNSRSFQEASSPKTTRYVEDMVDETLQNRIAEAFMEEPEKKGTLVIVTGDAQPAKYSDGFYKYATRALKWGWHIEVVCWRISCSSLWRDLAADESLRHRFRLIELDPYVGYLADGS